MELSFRVQIGGIFDSLLDEIDLAGIAFSCHFALDLLCDKTGSHDPALTMYLAPLPVVESEGV